MNGKIEISRELLELAFEINGLAAAAARHEIRQILAAPVVERQPDAIIEGVMTSVGITHAIYASTVSLKDKEQVRLYTSSLASAEVNELIEALEELLVGTGTSPGANRRYGKLRACLDKVKELNQ